LIAVKTIKLPAGVVQMRVYPEQRKHEELPVDKFADVAVQATAAREEVHSLEVRAPL
jgi:hypothetical protein